jgi:hypothetical protein
MERPREGRRQRRYRLSRRALDLTERCKGKVAGLDWTETAVAERQWQRGSGREKRIGMELDSSRSRIKKSVKQSNRC